MKEVYIIGAARTPVGKFLGKLKNFSAPELGSFAIQAAVERSGVNLTDIEDVFMGEVLQAGVGQAPARQAALKAGIPESASAATINKVCASGLEAIHLGALRIQAGEAKCVVVGGMESMSQAPHVLKSSRNIKLGDVCLLDSAVYDGLRCSFENKHMGSLAEFIARERNISRKEMDDYALNSHQKAVDAHTYGRLQEELVFVGDVVMDEAPRLDCTPEQLNKLKPVFETCGKVTAGNAPGLADGAAALVLAEKLWAKKKPSHSIGKN